MKLVWNEIHASQCILEGVEKAGDFDAMTVCCFNDPALEAAREIADIPVIRNKDFQEKDV